MKQISKKIYYKKNLNIHSFLTRHNQNLLHPLAEIYVDFYLNAITEENLNGQYKQFRMNVSKKFM